MGRRTSLSFVISIAIAIGTAVFAAAGDASGTSAPRNTAPPTVSGSPVEGSVLTADHGSWHSGPAVTYAYQWRRCLADGSGCTDIANATDRIYATAVGDVGHTLRVSVTATNRDGSAVATSVQTPAVTALPAAAPHATVAPSISGSTVAGRTLVAANGTWAGTAPIVFSYRWRRCSSAGGDCVDTSARAQSYKLSSGDVSRTLRVLVTARNAAGTAAFLTTATGRVTRPATPAPQNRSLPTVQGVARQGEQLRGTRGSWTNSPTSYAYAWLRCDGSGNSCSGVGAHGLAYSVGANDVGHTIRLEVDAKNAGGTTRAFSAPTAAVAAASPANVPPPANTTAPSISGTAQQGNTLTGDRGTWTNNPTSYELDWQRCDSDGHGCNGVGDHGTHYRLTSKDVGHRIRLRVHATNAGGTARSDSSLTSVVRASDRPSNTSPPTVSGTPQEGKTLSSSKGNWTHDPTSYDYAWLRCDRNGNNCATIGGAGGSTYTLGSADVGSTIRLRVTAHNSEGGTAATSVPTAVITKALTPPPSRGNGCPAGGNPDQVTAISAPARLLVDTLRSDPAVVTRGTSTLVVRFHVTSSCGGPVQGALVYATATPYNQFSIPPEAVTGSDGWATLVFRRLQGFPVSRHQQLIAMFVRARKPGESLLGGISTRRLVSIRVRLG